MALLTFTLNVVKLPMAGLLSRFLLFWFLLRQLPRPLFYSQMSQALSQTQIYLSKRRKVLLPVGQGGGLPEVVATTARNLQALGFGLTYGLLNGLRQLSDSQVIEWYESILPILRELVGAHRRFNPMYPNFPRQVMQASDAELFFNAMTHYFGFLLSDALNDPNLVMLPHYEKEVRPEFDEFHELRWIDLGNEEDFNSIFTMLAAANGSVSETDNQVLKWFIENRDVQPLLPPLIPQKETLAFLVAHLKDKDCLKPMIKTATDVLRVAVAMSGGDVSLAEITKFRSFSKSERRFLLSCLEQAGVSCMEDMLRWKERWVRLGERLHPGDFRRQFPNSLFAFDTLRNGLPYKTYNSKVENAIKTSDAAESLRLLTDRPGEFARRLDHLLRTFPDEPRVLEAFLNVADQVSTPVLLQVWGHIVGRGKSSRRAFFPKGNAAKVQLSETRLPPLPFEVLRDAANGVRQVLVERFSELPPLGKCFLDQKLQDQLVPFSQRSASRSLRTVARGSHFDLPDGGTIRFFCWWKNIESNDDWTGRVDIDLSASLFNERWEHCEDIAYYNLRSGESFHSGDITSAPKGACEFIDLSLPSLLSKQIRFVAMSLHSFTNQPFTALPECFGGWMMRQKPNSGEVFEPATVKDKVDLTAASRTSVPVIVDLVERRVYWTDIELKTRSQINNAAKNSVGFSQIGRAIVELNKPTLFELFAMHIAGRGQFVDAPDKADTVFGLHEGNVTAFEVDKILSQFML